MYRHMASNIIILFSTSYMNELCIYIYISTWFNPSNSTTLTWWNIYKYARRYGLNISWAAAALSLHAKQGQDPLPLAQPTGLWIPFESSPMAYMSHLFHLPHDHFIVHLVPCSMEVLLFVYCLPQLPAAQNSMFYVIWVQNSDDSKARMWRVWDVMMDWKR